MQNKLFVSIIQTTISAQLQHKTNRILTILLNHFEDLEFYKRKLHHIRKKNKNIVHPRRIALELINVLGRANHVRNIDQNAMRKLVNVFFLFCFDSGLDT